MEIDARRQVDLLYALFLGRFPENNFVREDNLGRPVVELARAMISSEEFKQSVLERFLLYQRLPHDLLPHRLLPEVLELIAESNLRSPSQGASVADWKATLGRVLADAPCRSMIEEAYGQQGRQLLEQLAPLLSPPRADSDAAPATFPPSPDIVSGVEVVANTLCRGWLVDQANPDSRLHVRLRVNGSVAKVLPADEFRRDVQDRYGGDGRAGFSTRLDLLPDARYLSRAVVEIDELSRGTVILADHAVELSPAPAIQIEAELHAALAAVRGCVGRLNSRLTEDRRGFADAFRGRRSQLDRTSAAEIGEELEKLTRSLDRIEADLPSLSTRNIWALSYYAAANPLLNLRLPPPSVEKPATFSVIVVAAGSDADAAATLASLRAQTLGPTDIALIAAHGAVSNATSQITGLGVVRIAPGTAPTSAVNRAARDLGGSHLLILEAGVQIAPEALAWLAAAIDRTHGLVLYADADRTVADDTGEHVQPIFRPAFDEDLLLQRNYIGRAFCIERQTYLALGGIGDDTVVDSRHDLLLRALAALGRGAFIHVPQVLFSNRTADARIGSEAASERLSRTVQSHLDRTSPGASAEAHSDAFGRAVPDAVKIRWPEPADTRISVIVPTRDRADLVFALASSLRRHAGDWSRVEIIVMVTGKLEPHASFTFAEIEKLFDHTRVVMRDRPFNWGEVNNAAVQEFAAGDIVVFLNDDILCLTDGWDHRLRGQLARPGVGVVGGRLLYPNGLIQHAGITFCGDETTAHEAMGLPPSDGLYLDRTLLTHEIGAVTGAFLACRRNLFETLGGFDAERYAVTSSDADFCVRARGAGKRVVYDPALTWIHYESVSRGQDAHDYKKQWRAEAEHETWRTNFAGVDRVDLSLNPHLTCQTRPFESFHRTSREKIDLWFEAQLRHHRDSQAQTN